MATFFGEVVVAPSRAGLDEEEEAREETPEDREIRREIEKKREIQVLWSCAEESLVCSRFIVAIGRNAAAFLSSFILDSVCWEVIGVVKLWNEWCRTSSSTNVLPTDSFCLFYRLIADPTVLLCQCSCYVAEDQQFQWLEKVFGSMQKKGLQVTILSTCPVADYKTQESTLTLVSPFLKALKTKEFQEQVCCPLLEQPNIVRDLPAAEQSSLCAECDRFPFPVPVLSYCQVWGIPAVLYQCYTDVIKLDTVTIEAFKPLLSSELLKSLAKDASESTKVLKKFLTASESHNNIYI
ncbi:proteasome assembly chaperone 1 isoform X1 [Zonotrichia leucophrys gambelii]|uniref:proteasome assembly chaperone 1 isoform X1 n=1 Tax=Zonotrichia leucophrys gambelii TaxID=257770 RepID=UPI0031401327